MRAPNAIDFWRGFALLNLLVTHIPDNGFWRFTVQQFSWSDGAEILIFLSGWVFGMRLAAQPEGIAAFAAQRAGKIYLVHVSVTFVLIMLYAIVQTHLGDERILQDNGIDPAFMTGGALTSGVLLLTAHVRFFDILPLYVLLTLLLPAMAAAGRAAPGALFAASAGLYALAQCGVNVPQWPSGQPWAFNPLAWQFVFVLGFLACSSRREIAAALGKARWAFPLAIAVVAGAMISMRFDMPPSAADRTELEWLLWSKQDAGPLRLVQFAALCIVGHRMAPAVASLFPLVWRMGSLLGRNGLVVFATAAVLSAGGQIAHRHGFHGVAFDTAYTGGAMALLLLCAHGREWSKRIVTLAVDASRGPASSRLSRARLRDDPAEA